MPCRKNISKALDALLSFQNEDGGIPATLPEKSSGCWTTASTLESILISGTYTNYGISRVKKIINFLLTTQITSTGANKKTNAKKIGSWALFKGADPSTMTTGHCVASLTLALNYFDDDTELATKIKDSINLGFSWLINSQNSDGSWGTLPNSGNTGSEGSIISIYYALLPFYYKGENLRTSSTVRKGVEYLINAKNIDGSWGIRKGFAGDVCNTARAISTLIRADYQNTDCTNNGISFIMANQTKGGRFWEIEAERFDIENAPAQVIYNDNTNCDVLMAFLEAGYINEFSKSLFIWLLNTQKDNGLWYLSSPTKTIKEICTWSTAEWTLTIDKATRIFFKPDEIIFEKKQNNKKIRFIFAGLIIGYFVIAFFAYKDSILAYWISLSKEIKTLIITGVGLAIGVNLVSGFLYDGLKTSLSEIRNYFKKKTKK